MLKQIRSQGTTDNGKEGNLQTMVEPLMLIIIKTPGKCTFDKSREIGQSVTGEHQDFILGEYIKENFSGFLYDTVTSEQNVYAFVANNSCHWAGMQNLCRSLFLDMKTSEVAQEENAILLPPGVNQSLFQDTKHHYALPNGFWPIAIRTDSTEEALYLDLKANCPHFNHYLEEETKNGILLGLWEQPEIKKQFAKLKSELEEQASLFKLANQISFWNLEGLFEEIEHRNIDVQLEEDTYQLLENFYQMFIYAKYNANTPIQVAMIGKLVALIREKIKRDTQLIRGHKSEKDTLTLLSIANKQMAALNGFLFQYSHDCFLDNIVRKAKGKNTCPGRISPTSNLIFKIDRVQLEEKIVSFIDGVEYELCRSAASADCPLDHFLKLIDHKMANVTHLVCHRSHTVMIDDFKYVIMAKIALLLFLVFIYYLVRYMLILMNEKKTLATLSQIYKPGFLKLGEKEKTETELADTRIHVETI